MFLLMNFIIINLIFFYNIIIKITQKENVNQLIFKSEFVYAMDKDYTPKISAFYTSFINEW